MASKSIKEDPNAPPDYLAQSGTALFGALKGGIAAQKEGARKGGVWGGVKSLVQAAPGLMRDSIQPQTDAFKKLMFEGAPDPRYTEVDSPAELLPEEFRNSNAKNRLLNGPPGGDVNEEQPDGTGMVRYDEPMDGIRAKFTTFLDSTPDDIGVTGYKGLETVEKRTDVGNDRQRFETQTAKFSKTQKERWGDHHLERFDAFAETLSKDERKTLEDSGVRQEYQKKQYIAKLKAATAGKSAKQANDALNKEKENIRANPLETLGSELNMLWNKAGEMASSMNPTADYMKGKLRGGRNMGRGYQRTGAVASAMAAHSKAIGRNQLEIFKSLAEVSGLRRQADVEEFKAQMNAGASFATAQSSQQSASERNKTTRDVAAAKIEQSDVNNKRTVEGSLALERLKSNAGTPADKKMALGLKTYLGADASLTGKANKKFDFVKALQLTSEDPKETPENRAFAAKQYEALRSLLAGTYATYSNNTRELYSKLDEVMNLFGANIKS